MKNLALSCAFIGMYCTSLVQAADSYALLIGVSKYENAHMNRTELKYPEIDAMAVAQLLEDGGFTVRRLPGVQATKAAIEKELQLLKQQGTKDGSVLIGLFGHGVQYEESAYYCPYDTKVVEVTDQSGNVVREDNGQPMLEPSPPTLVSMKQVLDALSSCGAESRILLADCCREDPSAARGRAFGNAAPTSIADGTAVLFACRKGQRAFEHDDWKHGAFTKAFLDACREGNDDLNTLSVAVANRVDKMVTQKTNARSQQSVHPLIQGVVKLNLRQRPRFPKGTRLANNLLKMPFLWCPNESAGFWVGQYEVTQAEWQKLMDSNPAFFSKTGAGAERVPGKTDNYPVENVSWQDAVEFCNRLTEEERLAGRLPSGYVYRLPTGKEWEQAASLDAASNLSQPEQLEEVAWFSSNSELHTHPIGQKRTHSFGPLDMLGNVAEWCLDEDKEDLTGAPMHMLRGGAFWSSSKQCDLRIVAWGLKSQSMNTQGLRVFLAPTISNPEP